MHKCSSAKAKHSHITISHVSAVSRRLKALTQCVYIICQHSLFLCSCSIIYKLCRWVWIWHITKQLFICTSRWYRAALAFIWRCISVHRINVSPLLTLLLASLWSTAPGGNICLFICLTPLFSKASCSQLAAKFLFLSLPTVDENSSNISCNHSNDDVINQNNELKDAKMFCSWNAWLLFAGSSPSRYT